MPELPEAETIKRDLAKEIIGQTITGVKVYDARILGNNSAKNFITQITNCKVANVLRRGKAIIIECEKVEGSPNGLRTQWLVIQLRMTGLLLYGENLKGKNVKDIKVVFELCGGQHLNYSDQRVFGRLTVIRDLNDDPYLKTLGSEPLNGSFAIDLIREQCKRRTIPVKTLLMDQHVIAGIGNIYASEILFSARLNPQKQSNKLTRQEIQAMYNAIHTVLNEAIVHRGTSIRNYRDIYGRKGNFLTRLKVYGRQDQPCRECRSPVKRISQSRRSTFFCEQCQK